MSKLILVTGLGRCGSSLTMQMLSAGGVPCLGSFPDFEDERTLPWAVDSAWLAARQGAVKLLDPHLHSPSMLSAAAATIFLTRDETEQAKSGLKLMHAGGFSVGASRQDVARIRASLRQDRRRAGWSLYKAGRPVLTLSFESLVTTPRVASRKLAEFLKPHFELDIDRMGAAVLDRGSDPAKCLPGMLEELLILKGAVA